MPVFAVEAIDSNGQKVKKEIDASSKDAAIKQIRSDGLRPTRISMKARSAAKADDKKKKWQSTLQMAKQASGGASTGGSTNGTGIGDQ